MSPNRKRRREQRSGVVVDGKGFVSWRLSLKGNFIMQRRGINCHRDVGMTPKNQPKYTPSQAPLNELILTDLVNRFQYGCSHVFGNYAAKGHLMQARQRTREAGRAKDTRRGNCQDFVTLSYCFKDRCDLV